MLIKRSGKIILSLLSIFFFHEAFAQNNFWNDVTEASQRGITQKRTIIPNRYRTLALDTTGLLRFLKSAPKEFTNASVINPAVLTIPMPDGQFKKFNIVESSMMEPALAARFPTIKTFSGQGIDDKFATIKIDWTPLGFHAMIMSPGSGTFAIDPYAHKTVSSYISYFKKDINPRAFNEVVDVSRREILQAENMQRSQAACVGVNLRSYRLAVACTGEYGQAVGATTKEEAYSAIVTSINRVNGVYEKELAIRLVLVAGNEKIVFINPATDPFTQNDDGNGLIDESQEVITDSIGSANFDIGHTFSTGGGGLAGLGVVCYNSNKAGGVTGLDDPTGDPYDIDYVAHEIGHQFGADHTFNAVTGSCGGGNRYGPTAVEPGSGSTIMGYAGICSSNNLQLNSDPHFHSVSFNEINTFVETGGSCGQLIATGNTPPVVNAGNDYIIPKSTPFMLTGSATDVNNDALTYSWEQVDVGPSGNWNSPTGNAPLFRSFIPSISPTRLFPKSSDLVNNTVTIGEILPSYARSLKFRLTVRDNRSGGGGQCSDEASITVASSGPLLVTSPNNATTWDAGDFKTVTWNVANTNTTPVNCTNVSIMLSTDGGLTFPIVIAASTPNIGSAEIRVPNNITTAARIRVMAVGNIFYDISNVNFTIRTALAPDFVFNNVLPVIQCSANNPTASISTGSLAGYNTPVTLTASGNPAGSTVVFSKNPTSAIDTVVVTLQGTIAAGIYDITVTGTSGSIVKNRVIQFQIGTPATVPVTPANNSTGVGLTPQFNWQAVPGANSYNLLIAGSSAFTDTVQSITGIAANSYKLVSPLAEDTKYYWRVSVTTSCGSQPSAGFTFITAVTVCSDTIYSTNVPLTIPTSVSTIASTISIAAGASIADVDVVGLKGTHTNMSDLSFTLTSPASTTVRLFGAACTTQDNFDINLNDEAPAGAITCPATGGQVRRPAQPLSLFDNQNSTGTWTLNVKDSVNGAGGSLTMWGLKICTYSTVYTFTGNGNWSNAANWKNNSVPPLTLPGGGEIIIDPTSGSCILDVPQVIATGSKLTVRPGKAFVVNVSLTFQ